MSFFRSIFVIGVLATSCCFAHNDDHDHDDHDHENHVALSPEQIATAGIETQIAKPQTLRIMISIPGKITINQHHQAHVVAKADGTVAQVSRNIGDAVFADETLAVLESKEVAEAKAAYITAIKREALALQMLASEEQLKNKKVSPEQDYLHACLNAKEAEINREVAQQKLYIFGLNQSQIDQLTRDKMSGLCCYEIKAPINGVVIAKDISVGSYVSEDDHLYTIADLDTVWVELGIYPQHLSQVKLGNKIIVTPIRDEHIKSEGELTQLCPIIDEGTRTAAAIATIPNKSRTWFPGTYVTANIVIDKVDVPVAVLKKAVQTENGESYIFVPHPEGFLKQEVVLGKSDGKYVEIAEGLQAGEPYASTETFLLKAELGKGGGGHDH